MAWVVGLTGLRIGLIAPQHCDPVTSTELDVAISQTASWALDNLTSDGQFLYRYDRTSGTDLGGYNIVRHAGMTNALYQLVLSEGQGSASPWMERTDASLGFLLERVVWVAPDVAAIQYAGNDAKLGAAGLAAAALVHRRLATGDTQHDDILRGLGRFFIGQIDDDGAVLGYFDLGAGRPIPGRYGQFATGEAAWSLAMLDAMFPGEGWGDGADRVIDYVVNHRRDVEALVLRQPDHWTAYALAERGPNRVDALPGAHQYAERLAGDFALMSRVEPQRSNTGTQGVVRFGQALGAGVGAMGEGLVSLWSLAEQSTTNGSGPLAGRADEVALRVECVVSLLVNRQVGPGDVVSDSEREIGAWFTDHVTQVDDQQHTLSTLLIGREILHRDEQSGARP